MALEWLDDEELPGDNYFPKRPKSIELPEFLNKRNPMSTEETTKAQVVLNNIPGSPNVDYENKKHFDELDDYSKNFDSKEWEIVLENAPYELMFDKLKLKMGVLVEYRTAMMDADEIMRKVRL